MKITNITLLPIEHDCNPISDALSTSLKRKALLVRIDTDLSIYGMGEAFLYGCSLTGAARIFSDQILGTLMGENPLDSDYLYRKMLWNTMAYGRRGIILGLISAVDIALWDIKGQAEGVSVSRLLFTSFHLDRIPSYASGGFYAPGKGIAELIAEAESYRAKGYGAMKLKVGRNPSRPDSPLAYMQNRDYGESEEQDLARIAAVRTVFPADCPLMVDANASYGMESIKHLAPEWINAGLYWVEEPLRFEDRKGLKEAKVLLSPVLIAGFETEQGFENFETLLLDGCVDVVQMDIGWAGGFTGCMRIGELARSYGKRISLHSFGSAVQFAASLQLAAAWENTDMIESEENPNPLRHDIIYEPFCTDNTMDYEVPDKPGLGKTWNWDAISGLHS